MDNMFLFTGFCLEDKFFSAKRDVLQTRLIEETRRSEQVRAFAEGCGVYFGTKCDVLECVARARF